MVFTMAQNYRKHHLNMLVNKSIAPNNIKITKTMDPSIKYPLVRKKTHIPGCFAAVIPDKLGRFEVFAPGYTSG